ncbi:hypothetical protein JR316_0004858 [Psilocybe cubensis]|uniref:Yeast cell wall synthesis Kre9/Knh1-like N-terminal domain-containing protein n=2 Tax=Psilocybe cubensis TaxID=181762 RepID=A0A8H7Y0N2_PSICU|nr:hypothetical protein JR316_0004858 [Psilocybe cubensis]KAH9482758.1 hypothetical protein JR316_0004858 [Psilocybe cubensis]
MRAVAALLAFASSALAYSVLSPNGAQGWTNQGAQLLTWQRVDTDRQNFTALLINQNITDFKPQVLQALVNGTDGSARLNPPSGGWPVGPHFRVNLVQDPNNLDTILAQSPEFTISVSTASVSSTGSNTLANTGATIPNTASGTVPTTPPDGSSASDPITVPTSAALPSYNVQVVLLAFLSLMGFVLA